MKNYYLLLIVFMSVNVFAQLNRNELFKLNNVTETEMNAIVTPNEGSVVYNTTDDGIYKHNGTVWTKIDNSLQSIVLNYSSGGHNLVGHTITANDGYHNFPLGDDVAEIQTIDTNIFTILGDGQIQVKEGGVYLMTAALASNNTFPEDEDIKYIFAAFLNDLDDSQGSDEIIGFFTRGYVDIPEAGGDTSDEFWGASGVFMYMLNANDIIDVMYRFDPDGTTTFQSWFLNIGMTKMQ